MRLDACLFALPPASGLTPPMPVVSRDRPSETEAISDWPKLEALGPSHERPRTLAPTSASAMACAPFPSKDRASQSAAASISPSLKACDPAQAPARPRSPISERPKAWTVLPIQAQPARNTSSALRKPETTPRHSLAQRRGRNSRADFAKRLLFSIRSRRFMRRCCRFRSCPKRSLCCRSQSSWMWRSPLAASANCFERVTVRRVDVTLASMRRTISSRSDTTLLPSLPTASAKGAEKGSECQGRPPVRGRDPSTSKGRASHLESKRRSL